MYLSAILDLKDKGIISFAIGRSNNKYTNRQFKARLDKAATTRSMSRVGRCIDNGPMEGFWGTLKCEMYYLSKINDYESLATAIEDFIPFCNFDRRQRRLDRLSLMSIGIYSKMSHK